MNTGSGKAGLSLSIALLCSCMLGGCASRGAVNLPYETGDYYDQYSPAHDYYPGQPGYPYTRGGYGYPVMFGPSIHFGIGRSSGVGVGTTFGW